MARRTPIIAGNWKLNRGTPASATELISELSALLEGVKDVEVVVCPPFTALYVCGEALSGGRITLGAQDVFWKTSGAFTGEVSPEMLHEAGVAYVIIGHSERRGRYSVPGPEFTPEVLRHFDETDATVNLKTKAALSAGITPIICVGETLREREAGETDEVVRTQVEGALRDVSEDVAAGLIFAYEPVWAIGTGEVCDAAEADRVCGVVRGTVARLYNAETVAEAVRVQYGGSMNPGNAAELLAKPNIDGGLVGGASLKAGDFAAIVQAAASGA